MDKLKSKAPRTPKSYGCSACERCFVSFGDVVASDILCVCGAVLVRRSLPRGIYELRSPEPDDRYPTDAGQRSPSLAGIPPTADLGYGESHGYGPAHGGPTGPGDAPAGGGDGASGGQTRWPQAHTTALIDQKRNPCLDNRS